jgi:hypothetical protein
MPNRIFPIYTRSERQKSNILCHEITALRVFS